MLKSPKIIVSGVIVLLVIVLLSLPDKTAAQLKLVISGFFVPLFRLETAAKSGVESAGNHTVPRRVLIEDLEKLTEENTRLRLKNQQLRALSSENASLREMLGLATESDWKFTAANVTGVDPMNWWRTVQIDRGKGAGIEVDMPVLSKEGYLIGKILEVHVGHSLVALLGDPKCKVHCMVYDTGESGIIEPHTSLSHQAVKFAFLPSSHSLESGQWVITSGKGGIFPKGIPVGVIEDWRPSGDGASTQARVKLAANMNSFEQVMVLVE